MQKLARQEGKALHVVAIHTDLFRDLKPSVRMHKRFDKEIEIKHYPNETNKECSLIKEMHMVESSRQG